MRSSKSARVRAERVRSSTSGELSTAEEAFIESIVMLLSNRGSERPSFVTSDPSPTFYPSRGRTQTCGGGRLDPWTHAPQRGRVRRTGDNRATGGRPAPVSGDR